MTPTDSWPSVRPSGTGSAPLTVCTSDVQIRAAVVLTIASSGPGSGMGFSTTPVSPTFLMTNARIVSVMKQLLCPTMRPFHDAPPPPRSCLITEKRPELAGGERRAPGGGPQHPLELVPHRGTPGKVVWC